MIYVFDLDGTLCTDTDGNYADARPLERRIEIVRGLADAGHTIIVETGRNRVHEELTRRQLFEWRVPHHGLSVGRKVPANVYVDDKAINAADFFEETH